MRLLKILLPLCVLLLGSIPAQAADFNPVNPPEPGVNFTLSTRCEPPEACSYITPAAVYAFGSKVKMRATGKSGFRFVSWTDDAGNEVSAEADFEYTMPVRDVTLTAHFIFDPSNPAEPSTPEFKDVTKVYLKIFPSDAGYFPNVESGKEYEVGSSVEFRVNGYTNYRFINWTRDDGEVVSESASFYYSIPRGDHTLTANFEYTPGNPSEPGGDPQIHRKLDLRTNLENAATLSGAGTYVQGTTHTVEARANAYFTFVNWTDDKGDTVSVSSRFNYTMPNRNATLTANYTYFFDPANPGEPGIPQPPGSVGTNMVAWPRFGMYDNSHVLIMCETYGSTIHYTLDGTDPTDQSPLYTEPVYVSSNVLVKAIAYKEGMEHSPVTSFRVTSYHAGIPVYTFENRKIKISSSTPGATIRYTLDFSEPNEESEVYTEPLEPEENCRIKAYASKEGLTDSPVSIYVFRRAEHTLPAPTFAYNTEGKLVIYPAVAGGTTYYTTDGSEPDPQSSVYTEPITLPGSCIVKAYTTHDNYFDSPTGTFEALRPLPAPRATFAGHLLTLTCDDDMATILYAFASTGDLDFVPYTGPIELTGDCTVVFYAVRESYNDSERDVFTFVLADFQEDKPLIDINYIGRTIAISHPQSLKIAVVYNESPDAAQELETPAVINVDPGMSSIAVSAIATNSDRYDSEAERIDIVFHSAPRMEYDGHTLRIALHERDQDVPDARCEVLYNGSESTASSMTIEPDDFGAVEAVVISGSRFRSETEYMSIDRFNTGTVAGVRNGGSLHEVFGTWGDAPEDYTSLLIVGETAASDLAMLAGLPALDALRIEASFAGSDDYSAALAGSRLTTLYLGEAPDGILRNADRLTTLVWTASTPMPGGILTENGNPNMLVWVTDPALAPADARNIVQYPGDNGDKYDPFPGIEGTSDFIELTPGYPFGVHSPVDVKDIVFTKEFTQPTEIGVCRGWETIALPFAPQAIVHETKGDIVPFALWDGTDLGPRPFWLYSATADGWVEADAIEPCEPYIISMPNNPEYIEQYNLPGKVMFSAADIRLDRESSLPKTSAWIEGHLFKATFLPVDETALALNTEGEGGFDAGSKFVAEATARPFGAYVTSESGSMRAVPVFGQWSGISLPTVAPNGAFTVDTPAAGTLRVRAAAPCTVRVCTTTGIVIRLLRMEAGQTVCVEHLAPGIYIAGGTKVIVN